MTFALPNSNFDVIRFRPRLIDTRVTKFVISIGNVPEPRRLVPNMPSVAEPKISGSVSKAVSLSKSTKTLMVGAGIRYSMNSA